MGLWQIFNADGVAQDEQFDDGLAFFPGEDGFTIDVAAKHAASLGKGFTFNLIGVPNGHARIEAERIAAEEAAQAARDVAEAAAAKAAQDQARAEAEAELAAMLDPDSVIRGQINAKFDALLAAAPARAKDIKKLRTAALAELEV